VAGGTRGTAAAPPAGEGTQPRSTSTADPSGKTKGVTTSKPTTPSRVRLRTRISCDWSNSPVMLTRVHAAPAEGFGPTRPGPGGGIASASGTGAAVAEASILELIALRSW
jgi:hypothetical protein